MRLLLLIAVVASLVAMHPNNDLVGWDLVVHKEALSYLWPGAQGPARTFLRQTPYDPSSKKIRRWGCHRNETPAIYVHIGKAGGGQVRTRFAAAALDFNRENWRVGDEDNHYYPLPGGEKAKFCNSQNRNHRYADTQWSRKTYEGNLPCNASTPLGMVLACPNAYQEKKFACPGCRPNREDCHTVYVGHNLMGSEFHWLPAKYLQRWWNATGKKLLETADGNSNGTSLTMLDQGFEALIPSAGPYWCPWRQIHRPRWETGIEGLHGLCGAPLAALSDSAFRQLYDSADYSPFYASLPLHRVVLLRDPWTWIVSKLFWHRSKTKWIDSNGRMRSIHCHNLSHIQLPKSTMGGWADQHLFRYLSYLCGDDCEQRLERGLMTIGEAEVQAANNLRHSFSVVGLLEDIQTFYNMVTARIAYLNMSLNPEVQGELHSSKRSKESITCSRIYQNRKFQEAFREAVPLMSVMERLYKLAVEVNTFQQQDLNECLGAKRFKVKTA